MYLADGNEKRLAAFSATWLGRMNQETRCEKYPDDVCTNQPHDWPRQYDHANDHWVYVAKDRVQNQSVEGILKAISSA
jgi:hypothetical protein